MVRQSGSRAQRPRPGTAAALLILLVVAACVSPAGQEIRAARTAAQEGRLEEAWERYEAALALEPSHATALAERQALAAQLVQGVLAEAERLAGEPPTAAGLREAIAYLDAAQRWDLTGDGLTPARGRYQEALSQIDAANQARAAQARLALDTGRLELAAEEIAAIRKADPAWAGLGELDAEYARALERRVEASLGSGDIPGARQALRRLESMPGQAARAEPLRRKFAAAELDWLRARVEDDMAAGRYYTAYLRILDSGREAELGDLVATLRRRGGEFYLGQAQLRMARGETARAYLEAVKGLELAPHHPALFEVHRDARDAQLEQLQTYIAVPTFATPRDHPELGAQFSDALISYLFRVLPYGINIVEREKIDLLIREQDRGFAELGDVLDVDLIISGNVSLMKIDRQDSEQEGIARAQIGERQEPNPAYEVAYRAATKQPDARVDPNDLPPPTITVPIYESIRYQKGSVTIKGFATVAARIFSTQQAAIVYAQEFNARYTASDSFQDEVASAGIAGDPLELPTETEIIESLRNELVEKVAAVIEEYFEARHRTFLKEAQYRLSRREPERAMEPLAAGFLYTVQAKIPSDDPDLIGLRDLILVETERRFLPGPGPGGEASAGAEEEQP